MSAGERPLMTRLGAAVARIPGWAWALAGIVLVGLALRITFNDVARYSSADEGHYVAATRTLAQKGWSAYPELVRDYLARPEEHAYPSPIRWGYLGMAAITCAVRAPCDGRALAWLSTIAGALSIVLTFLVGARLVGRRAALLAAAITVTSPLQLALSRRALTDEVYCAAFLAAVWALLRLVQDDKAAAGDGAPQGSTRGARGRVAAFVLTSAVAFAVKEAFAFPYVGLAAVYLLAPRGRALRLRDLLVLLAPPVLFFATFAILSRSARAFVELLVIGQASFLSDYSAQHQSGPPHRPLFDLFVLAPIVCLLAASAIGRILARGGGANPRPAAGMAAGGERVLAALLMVSLVAFMGLPKNLRFVVILDPILRLLAAWTWVEHHEGAPERAPGRAVIAALLHAAPELALFHRTFIAHKTYDPTTHDVLQALGAVPRPSASAEPSTWPTVFFAASSIAVAALVLTGRRLVTTPADSEREGPAASGPGAPAAEESAPAGGDGASGAGSPANAPPAGPPKTSTRERVITIGAGAACLAIALLVGRSCGGGGAANGPNAATTAAPADPAAAQVNAGVAATDPNVAVQHFRKALELHPGHYGATFQLARALDRAGRRDEAIQQWQRVLLLAEQARDQPLAEMARARIAQADPMTLGLDALYSKRDPVAAAARFREVLAQNPEHYGAVYQLAAALHQAQKLAEARPLWEKMVKMADAIADAKTAETARARLAEIDKALGPPAPADPEAEAMREAVDALYTKRDPASASALFRKILARSPEHYGATYQLATALDQANKPSEARPVWEKVLKAAEAANDTKTVEAARARLAKRP